MEKFRFKIGDVIVPKHKDFTYQGTITSINGNIAYVQWDDFVNGKLWESSFDSINNYYRKLTKLEKAMR